MVIRASGVCRATPARSCDALEVTIVWNRTVQSVLERRLSEKKDVSFFIGEDPVCDFAAPTEQVGGVSSFPLARVRGGVLEAAAASGMGLRILREDGSPKPLSADENIRLPESGPRRVVVSPREIAEISVGSVLFRIRMTQQLSKVRGGVSLDRRTGAFIGFSAVLHAAVLFALCLAPPEATGLHMDDFENFSPMMKIMLSAPEAEAVLPPKPDAPQEVAQAGGAAHAGPSGQMGDRAAKRTRNRSAVRGPSDNLRPTMMREAIKEDMSNQGIIGMISALKMPASPFGSDTPSGFDPENALGALVGNEIGSNFGMGGLGPKGVGRGGGGNAEGGIGVGSLGRIAWSLSRANCKGAACPGWTGGTAGMSGRRVRGPKLKSGNVSVVGSLSKETIRRIVRRHLNEVRFCYEQGLRKRPDLSGQVAVKFVIAASGKVQSAAVARSSISDAQVAMCISNVVNRMTFPTPKNSGIVIVTYPFSLTAAI